MSLLTLLVGICIFLFALYLVKSFMPQPWATPTLVVIVLLALIWLAQAFVPGLSAIRISH